MMRHLVAAVVWGWAACAYPAAFDGSFLIDDAQSRIVAKLEEKGERLMGTIEFVGQGRINLVGTIKNNTARGSATSKDGTGEFEARIDGDTLSLTISQKEGPNQKAARLPLLFQRAGSHANNGGGDARLVGHWSYQNLIVSGNASFASEEHIVFRADGSYVYGKGATTAGASDWSYDSGQDGDREHGFWRAENRVLFVSDGRGWTRVGTYGMTDDGAAMRITYDGGGKKLWSRARER